MAPYRIAIMNKDIAKFVYDSMQQRTKIKTKIMKSTSLRAFSPVFKITRLSPKLVRVNMQVLGQTKTRCIYT